MTRKLTSEDFRLYVITDRSWLREEALEDQVQKAIDGGATFLQIREKELPYNDFVIEAARLKKLATAAKIPFVVNDNVDAALAVDADGVHIGQEDGEAARVREALGPDKILGVSAHTLAEALAAEAAGADYLGVGAAFATATKQDASTVSFETLKAICSQVHIPVVAIGGLNETTIPKLGGSGVDGVAVISAVFSAPDITKATRRLRRLSEEMVKGHA
ncbi:MAG: thiamine phosphate synthase [Eubacterium sp.]|nr:thiamine phosphate synthase [Eubacterium sp.]